MRQAPAAAPRHSPRPAAAPAPGHCSQCTRQCQRNQNTQKVNTTVLVEASGLPDCLCVREVRYVSIHFEMGWGPMHSQTSELCRCDRTDLWSRRSVTRTPARVGSTAAASRSAAASCASMLGCSSSGSCVAVAAPPAAAASPAAAAAEWPAPDAASAGFAGELWASVDKGLGALLLVSTAGALCAFVPATGACAVRGRRCSAAPAAAGGGKGRLLRRLRAASSLAASSMSVGSRSPAAAVHAVVTDEKQSAELPLLPEPQQPEAKTTSNSR